MLQCSLLVEKHCSNSKKINGDGKVVGVGFWGVFSLKLALKRSHRRCSYSLKIETVVKKPGFHTYKWK